jgi:hypothetical protein
MGRAQIDPLKQIFPGWGAPVIRKVDRGDRVRDLALRNTQGRLRLGQELRRRPLHIVQDGFDKEELLAA